MPIRKVKKIWMNGKMVDWEDARVHVLTHGLHYGSGVFEGIRCYKTNKGPAIFRFEEHLKRLENSARTYFMDIPYPQEELSRVTKELIKINGLKSCYIRPLVYRGYGEMGVNPLKASVDVSIAVWPWGTYLGQEALENGIKTKTSAYRRIPPSSLPTNAKATGQYLNSILGKIEAIKCGCDEAIMLDSRGFISEGTGENLFVVKEGKIYTTPECASILPGLTRDTVITMARDMGYEVEVTELTMGFLYSSDEAFFTGTAAEITPIKEVDGRMVGKGKPGTVTKRIQKKFFRIVRGEESKYRNWLDYV